MIKMIMANMNDISIGILLKNSNLFNNLRIGYTNGSVTKNKNCAILLSSSGENHDIIALPNIRNCIACKSVITNLVMMFTIMYCNKSPLYGSASVLEIQYISILSALLLFLRISSFNWSEVIGILFGVITNVLSETLSSWPCIA